MNRGGGSRVVEALDSPQTSKGCIMRSSLISPSLHFFFFFPSFLLKRGRLHTAYSLQVLQMCLCDRMFASVVSHSRGYFGLWWVEFRWCILTAKAPTIYSQCCSARVSSSYMWPAPLGTHICDGKFRSVLHSRLKVSGSVLPLELELELESPLESD